MQNTAFATGAAGGFLLAIAGIVLATQHAALGYQQTELLGLGIMLLGLVATQWLALHRATAMSQPAHRRQFVDRLRVTLVATLAMCLTYGALLWLYYAAINPEHLANYFEQYRSEVLAMAQDAANLAQREKFVSENRDFMLDPFKQSMLMAGTLLGIGGMSAAIVAMIFRRSAKQ
jgi:hypothetical protein